MNKILLELIVKKRDSGSGFSRVRKELIHNSTFDHEDINKAIGIIHDHETKILQYEISRKKNFSIAIGSFIIFILSSVYTLFSYLNPNLSYFVLLYGPIIAGFVVGFASLEKYRSAKNQVELLRKKY